jgi:hypothetical protein
MKWRRFSCPSCVWETFQIQANRAADHQARLERELISALLADPAAARRLLPRLNLVADDFSQPDLKLMFLAVEVAGHRGKLTCLRLIRRALQAENLWDDSLPACSSALHWSNRSLCEIACSFPSSSLVPMLAGRLRKTIGHLRRARRHWRGMQKHLQQALAATAVACLIACPVVSFTSTFLGRIS